MVDEESQRIREEVARAGHFLLPRMIKCLPLWSVCEESRTYPRPMGATELTNEPFNLQPDEVAELWEAVRESGAYPDLDTVVASNGDVYYFSTEYLSPTYAASLAKWNSVERDMYL